jgi:hypothetical protein
MSRLRCGWYSRAAVPLKIGTLRNVRTPERRACPGRVADCPPNGGRARAPTVPPPRSQRALQPRGGARLPRPSYAGSPWRAATTGVSTALSEEVDSLLVAAGAEPHRPCPRRSNASRARNRERHAVVHRCGTGRDTPSHCRGWQVLAIDLQTEAIERLRLNREAIESSDRLQTLVFDFDCARWQSVDLVSASYSLPFCGGAAGVAAHLNLRCRRIGER